jgi:hypothetical protein
LNIVSAMANAFGHIIQICDAISLAAVTTWYDDLKKKYLSLMHSHLTFNSPVFFSFILKCQILFVVSLNFIFFHMIGYETEGGNFSIICRRHKKENRFLRSCIKWPSVLFLFYIDSIFISPKVNSTFFEMLNRWEEFFFKMSTWWCSSSVEWIWNDSNDWESSFYLL